MELEENREKPNVLITGTPGTGKTTLAKLLGEYVEGFKVVNVGQLVLDKKLYHAWNKQFDVPEFDEDLVIDELDPVMSAGGVVVDFHSSGFFPERWFDLVVLLRANNTVLFDRLKARGYSQQKISENVECEIFEVSKEEVLQAYKPQLILELANEQPEHMQQNILTIIQYLTQWKQQHDQLKQQQQQQQL